MIGRVIIAATLCCILASTVRAELTAFWRHNPITSEAIADDPALAGMHSWSLMVTNTSGTFAGAGLRAILPANNFYYRNPNGGNFRPTPAQQIAHPAVEFHTYVAAPDESHVIIVGGFPQVVPPHSFGGPLDPIPGTFSVSWGDPIGSPTYDPGTYELARLTFPRSVLPTVHPESIVSYYKTPSTVLIPTTIPEPASVIIAALMFYLSHRRRDT